MWHGRWMGWDGMGVGVEVGEDMDGNVWRREEGGVGISRAGGGICWRWMDGDLGRRLWRERKGWGRENE